MQIATYLHTYFFGKYVGRDEYGNRYFRSSKNKNSKERRWVLYNGVVEASKVPANWHMWLRFTTDHLPNETQGEVYKWQKSHQPNFTLTRQAYDPIKTRKNRYSSYQKWNLNN